ncbi:MAG: threonylcarbamoyl-AMP synthase [Clostridia bacterium]|nr:threonylcarbamoyl-AMP synthase [Clostridia bacterium]
MKTQLVLIDPNLLETGQAEVSPADRSRLDHLLLPAAEALRAGELVAFPTETVYGLGANALDARAVAKIFAAKGRPGDNPLIIHVAHPADIEPLTTGLIPLAHCLLAAFAPGPLTLILPRSALVPDIVTAGLETVAVRIPAHPVARRLIELAGVPVAAPSANRSGRPSPTRAWHVEEDFSGVIPYIIDGGSCEFGLESTVLDLTDESPMILRPGAITQDMIDPIIGKQSGTSRKQGHTSALAPKSPGMKYRHYAPKARLVICDQSSSLERASCLLAHLGQEGWPSKTADPENPELGLYLCRDTLAAFLKLAGLAHQADLPSGLALEIYAEHPDPLAASHHLFNALRSFDRRGLRLILAEGLPQQGQGLAYMNRLGKAAGGGELV